ncbi:MAG: FAD-binding protein [Trueperaceae bacterium]|nr:MAG: FAD-binding protein [Trueperaceae bacterium]
MALAAGRFDELRRKVRANSRLRPVGAGSKPALSGWGNLMLEDLRGVLEYDPGEYTFTALAATPLKEIEAVLAENDQYLPFDPPLSEKGATLGGTVAAGLSGPGRLRYGGVRDFLLGVRFIDGRGELISGGGKVVKNAAGFDLPKLMVGSLGQFGVMLELTFKVFPKPQAYVTVELELASLTGALDTMQRLVGSRLEVTSLDLEPPSRLRVRLGGTSEALPTRLARLEHLVGQAGNVLEGSVEQATWRSLREFDWLSEGHGLLKIPVTPGAIAPLEQALAGFDENIPRRYSVAGNVAWLGWPESLGEKRFEKLLDQSGLSALAISGRWSCPLLGAQPGRVFAKRLGCVLDPEGKFQPGDLDAT